MKQTLTILLIFGFCSTYSQNLPKTANKMLKSEFGSTSLSISAIDTALIPSKPKHLQGAWRVEQSGKDTVYLLLAEGKGRTEPFRFFALLKADGSVLRVQVFEYNSTHGIQVTSTGWQSKLRVNANESLVYGKNVDAITGATISAKSLISTLEEVRKHIVANLDFWSKPPE